MQAILTKIIPATNKRPTRIKASCARGSIVLTYHNIDGSNKHQVAVKRLCAKFADEDKASNGTPLNLNTWSKHFVSGELPDGSQAHVFVE